ncbi:MAG: nickel pincer cofactor biosynthesis protein LarC [Synergistaceae bacterium]
MKKLHIECNMGAAGDMITGALYELIEDKKTYIEILNNIGLKNTKIEAITKQTCGITGTKIKVTINGEEEQQNHDHDHEHDEHCHEHHHDHDHEHNDHCHGDTHTHHHEHSTIETINRQIDTMQLPKQVKENAKQIYNLIAQVESQVHNKTINEIHFHEVGTKDAIADIIGACLAIHIIAPDEITATPIKLGYGTVKCAHGIIPVPAPATALLLKGTPCYSGDIESELCTPTGAAIIKHFAQKYEQMKQMTIENIGYGIGTQEHREANCIRAILGNIDIESPTITELQCHIDDMTAEALAYASQKIMESGALDVATHAITMKKGRLGYCLTVICSTENEEKITQMILQETLTNGVRIKHCGRSTLTQQIKEIETQYGKIKVKQATGKEIKRTKPEYEDIAKIAKETGQPFCKIYDEIKKDIN